MSAPGVNQIPCAVCNTGLVGIGKGQICGQCRSTYNLGRQGGAPESLPKILEFLHRANSTDVQRILMECNAILANRRQQQQAQNSLSGQSTLPMMATTPTPTSGHFQQPSDYGSLDPPIMLHPTFQFGHSASSLVDPQHYGGVGPGSSLLTPSAANFLTNMPQAEVLNTGSQFSMMPSSSYAASVFDHPAPAPDRDSSSTVDSQRSGGSRPKPLSANTISSWEYPYRCTFPPCTASFRRKHEWKRHESSSHDPQFLYTCHFCRDREKPFTHTRRDKLGVHLQSAHGLDKDMRDPAGRQALRLEELERPPWTTDHPRRSHRWGCGFCSAVLTSWDVRANHIADHFQARCSMEDWHVPVLGDDEETEDEGGRGTGVMGRLVKSVKRLSTEDYANDMDCYDDRDADRYG